jgi:hypothetical protein
MRCMSTDILTKASRQLAEVSMDGAGTEGTRKSDDKAAPLEPDGEKDCESGWFRPRGVLGIDRCGCRKPGRSVESPSWATGATPRGEMLTAAARS